MLDVLLNHQCFIFQSICSAADLKCSNLKIDEFNDYCDKYLRGVTPDSMDTGAELGVLDAVYFYHIRRGLVHAVVFVCQFIPCRL